MIQEAGQELGFVVGKLTGRFLFEHPKVVDHPLGLRRLGGQILGAYQQERRLSGEHFHEFEDWQFDWLLESAGWHITHREKWTSPTGRFGVRPLLRRFTPRYYGVIAERS